MENGDDRTILKVDTEETKYELSLSIDSHRTDESVRDEYPTIFIESNNIKININSLVVEGYKHENTSSVSECSVNLLKPVLKSLAYKHSQSVQGTNSKAVSCKYKYSCIVEDSRDILSMLFEFMERKFGDEIDSKLFRKGVEKLSSSSDDIFKAEKDIIYVRSSGLQSKFFFKFSGTDILNCKIINTVHKHLPLVYDLLLCIFFFSESNVLQHCFQELIDYYYRELGNKLDKMGLSISNILPTETYQKQIYTFTPYVKLEVALSKWQHYLKSLNILDDHSYLNDVWSIFDTHKLYNNAIWKSVLEVYDSVLYTKLSREDCYTILENKLGSSDYEFVKWQLVSLGKRSGYLGDYYKLNIDIVKNDEKKTLNLFAKYLPTYSDSLKDIAEISFDKEEFFYVKFISELNSVGLNEITNFAPKCYFSRKNDVIILEDMSAMNCNSLGKGEALSYDNILLVIKQLAKVHACSLLYEEIMSEKLGEEYRIGERNPKFVQETMLGFRDGKYPDLMVCGVVGTLKYLLDVFPDIPKKITMETFKEKLQILFNDTLPGDLKSDVFRNVVTHGDPWGNNFLFERDEKHKLIRCYLIDYQLVRYCPPSHDLLLFLYMNTDKEMRNRCLSELILIYYSELSQIFKKYNFDLSKIYTFEKFLESCEFMKPMAICLASLCLQIVLYPQEKVDNLIADAEKLRHVFTVDRKELLDEVHHNEFYKKRMREVVEDLYEICENSVA